MDLGIAGLILWGAFVGFWMATFLLPAIIERWWGVLIPIAVASLLWLLFSHMDGYFGIVGIWFIPIIVVAILMRVLGTDSFGKLKPGARTSCLAVGLAVGICGLFFLIVFAS